MMGRWRSWSASILALTALVCARGAHAEPPAPDFRFDVRPILSKNCFACHGPDEGHREAGLRLDDREAAIDHGVLMPGEPDDSELLRRIMSEEPDERMPPPETGRGLSDEEIETLRRWIAAGAEYAQHWSYEPPRRPPLPAVSRPDWCRNEIDYFVLARLDEAGLAPEPEADRYRLIRRLSLDLTGLPPTIEEVDAFVHDERPDAYERLVDRLLSSPAYGEHWARKWLDLARYADTTGYEKDSMRTIWPFRDWVIHALNADMPFDQFTIEQLAGDLLDEPTKDQIIATAFHRNTMQNDEGGVDKEEYRTLAVIDRVNTTMQVWMGATAGCAQCHSHKYDPLSHREYFELLAFFNQTADANRLDQEPTLLTPTLSQQQLKFELDQRLEEINHAYDSQASMLDAAQRDWEAAVLAGFDWRPLEVINVASQAGATLTVLDDGSVLASGESAETDTYTIHANTHLPQIAALRIVALPHDSLPADGPGRADDGGFVLSSVRASGEPTRPVENVKHVRLEFPDRHDYLKIAEVEVFCDEENVALAGRARQSSTAYGGCARLAIDGSTNPHFATGRSIAHTAFEHNPWWEVTLPQPTRVDRVRLWNENAYPQRLIGARVSLLDASRRTLWQQTLRFAPDLTATLTVSETPTPQIAWAAADSERDGFPALDAIKHRNPTRHGWSPQRGTGLNPSHEHALMLGFEESITFDEPARLKIVLDQQTKIDNRGGQTLGRFRILATDDPRAATAATVPPAIRAIVETPESQRTPEQIEELAAYYRSLRPELAELVAQRQDIERRLKEEYRPDKTPIMKELPPEEQRKTHVFLGGSFLSPGEEVGPATPEVFHPFPDEAPRNRLGLAQWLVSRDNPLTARVVANRHWEELFGAGIVLTSEDFGSQGMLPTHPELLDWLAIELMEGGWSLKQLAKTIVMSAAYRQSSRTTPEKLARDPDNRLISRGPRYRITAEQIRDQALAASGLLSRKIGGPSVMPPQPEGVWEVVYSDHRWLTSEGEDRYRRGLYTFWRRTAPYPSAMALDATSRETCTIRRIPTNTPIAAFALLNDPVYVEAAQALARRVIKHEPADVADRATYAFRRVLARPPTADEVDSLVALFESERGHYEQDATAAAQMATSELGPPNEPYDVAELAAWTVVGNVLLNLDEMLNK